MNIRLKLAIFFTAFCFLATPAQSQQRWRIYGSNAGRNVATWMRIISPGPSSKPIPILWVSREKINIRGFPEMSSLISESDMIFLINTFKNLKCANGINAEIVPGSIQVFVREHGREVAYCKMRQAEGCEFINRISIRVYINELDDLAGAVNCRKKP